MLGMCWNVRNVRNVLECVGMCWNVRNVLEC